MVHEAYVRLVDGEADRHWDSRGHFFSAAAEAMRRIHIDNARRKPSVKHGGEFERVAASDLAEPGAIDPIELLALDEAIVRLEAEQPENSS